MTDEEVVVMNKRMKLGSIAVALPLLIIGFKTETMKVLLSGNIESLQNLSHGSLWLLLFFTLLLMTIQNLFTIIPLILLISINVSLFGFTGGYIWSWLISIAGATVSFLITRYWFQDFFAKYVNSQWESKIEENGFGVVFIGRVMPFMPTSVVNIAAAISSIRFMKFFYATVLGNMILFFILSSISLGILSIPWENSLYVVSAAFALLVIMVIRKRRKKAGRTPMTPPE